MSETELALEAFNRLSSGDRRAIERHLTDAQRKALRALVTSRKVSAAPATTARVENFQLGRFSPWLAKRLQHVIALPAQSTADVTDATREALRTLLLRDANTAEQQL